VVLPFLFEPFLLPKVLLIRAAALGLAVLVLTTSERRPAATPLDRPLLIWIAVAGAATVFSASPTVSIFGAYQHYTGLVTFAAYVALFWSAATFVRSPAAGDMILRSLVAGTALVAIGAIAQSMNSTASAEGPFGYGGVIRADSTMGNPVALGSLLAIGLPVATSLLLQARSIWSTAVSGLAWVFIGAGTIASLSRSSLVAALVGTTLVLILRNPWSRSFRSVLATVLVAGVALTIAIGPSSGALVSRFRDLTLGPDSSATARQILWMDALGLVVARPLVGYGPDTFGVVYPSVRSLPAESAEIVDTTESGLLDLIVTQGVLGLGALTWAVWSLAGHLIRSRRTLFSSATIGAWAAGCIAILFAQPNAVVVAMLWLLAGAACGLSVRPERRRTRRIRPQIAVGLVAVLFGAFVVVRPFVADLYFGVGIRGFSVDLTESVDRIRVAAELAPEVVDYPDSGKFGVLAEQLGPEGKPQIWRFVGRADGSINYWDGE